MESKKVLVTGGDGLIGRAGVQDLRQRRIPYLPLTTGNPKVSKVYQMKTEVKYAISAIYKSSWETPSRQSGCG